MKKKEYRRETNKSNKKKGKGKMIWVIIAIIVLLLLAFLFRQKPEEEIIDDTKGFQQIELTDQEDVVKEKEEAENKVNDESMPLEFSFMQEAQLGKGGKGIYIGHNKENSQVDYLGATVKLITGQKEVLNTSTGKNELQNQYEDLSGQMVVPIGKKGYVTELTKDLAPGIYNIVIRYVRLEPVIEVDAQGKEDIVGYTEVDKAFVYHTPTITLKVSE